MSTSRIMLASALAGAFARVPTHPLDTLKARIQAASPPPSLPTALQSLLRAEGVRGLYRGFAFTFAVSVPASCMYFTTYELSKGPSAASHFAAGMLAETVSCVLWVPCDGARARSLLLLRVNGLTPSAVIKERMQVQAFSTRAGGYGEYASGWGALRHIARSEGVRGLYKGYWATLASFGPMSATYFMFYEQLRARLVRRVGGDAAAVPHAQFWLAGGLAGGAAAWITTPLDLVKLRMRAFCARARARTCAGSIEH